MSVQPSESENTHNGQSISHGPRASSPSTTENNQSNASRTGHPVSSLAIFAAKMPNSTINGFCGAMAGVASGIVTCPLDVIKTRLQSQGSFRPRNMQRASASKAIYSGLVGTARVIWKDDGLRGMYRGLGPMLLGYLPTWAVYMSVYDSSKDYWYTTVDNKAFARIYASITAGACSTLATNPIWVIKTRLMSQVSVKAAAEHRPPWHYSSTFDAARKMYRTEGLRAFYSGLTPALLGLTHVAIQFPLYEYFKTQFTGLEMGENSSNDSDMHWMGILGATFLSKICATSATYPHEVLRTRLQTQQINHPSPSPEGISFRGSLGSGNAATRSTSDGVIAHSRFDNYGGSSARGGASSDGMTNLPRYRGVIRTCKIILQEEGWRAFYNGMGTNMVRAVPAAMTTMLTFETLKKAMYDLRVEGRRAREEEL